MIELYVSSAWAGVQSCYMRNFTKLQENMKAMFHGTQSIGLFVRIKWVNSFKENKADVVGCLAGGRQNPWLKEGVLTFHQSAQSCAMADSESYLVKTFPVPSYF